MSAININSYTSGATNYPAYSCSASLPTGIGLVLASLNISGSVSAISVKLNGNAMTLLTSSTNTYVYYIYSATAGTYTLSATWTGTALGAAIFGVSYINNYPTGQPYAYIVNNSPVFTGSNPYTGTISITDTVSYYDDWIHGFFYVGLNVTSPLSATGATLLHPTQSPTDSGTPQFIAGQLTPYVAVEPPSYPISFISGPLASYSSYGMVLILVNTRRSANSFSSSVSENIMNSAQPIGRFSYVGAGSVPSIAPIISFRYKTSPFGIISSILNYIKTSFIGTIFPVLNNEDSDPIYLRIYNNFTGGQHVADALNVQVTTWDGNSLTASMAVASQQWLHIQQNGFGEGSSGGALFTEFPGVDYAIGGTDYWSADNASNGMPGVSEIRSASNWPGTGFLELKTYINPKAGNTGMTNNFVIACSYEYSL